MKKIYCKLALIVLTAALAGCSGQYGGFMGGGQSSGSRSTGKGLAATSVDKQGHESNVNITMTGGGAIGVRSMDADDKKKLSRALDAGTGKSTHWENGVTGVSYTVTPIKKVVVQGNPFCRQYSIQASRGSNSKTMNGTACVTTDGSWHSI